MSAPSIYREVVLDHFRNPRGAAPLLHASAEAFAVNATCGDEVRVQLDLEGRRIAAASIHGRGCAISTASGSMLAQWLGGRTLEDALRGIERFQRILCGEIEPESEDLGDAEALFDVRTLPVRVKCALLPWMTLRAAIDARGEATPPPRTA